jgi:kynurenine formamidase
LDAESAQVRGWLSNYEKKYGKRGTSSMTTEKVPLSWTCGEARVIDVRSLIGTTKRQTWPISPEITVDQIKSYEDKSGPLKEGEVVIFQTGYNDKFLNPPPKAKDGWEQSLNAAMWQDPLSGKSEGWPAPGPDAIVYLKSKGIRCVASDAPDLGGVEPGQALKTYWSLGSNEMVGVELLVNVGKIPKNAYFLFAPIKVRDCHGGPGRAIVLY